MFCILCNLFNRENCTETPLSSPYWPLTKFWEYLVIFERFWDYESLSKMEHPGGADIADLTYFEGYVHLARGL
jgi:hypothetical protein